MRFKLTNVKVVANERRHPKKAKFLGEFLIVVVLGNSHGNNSLKLKLLELHSQFTQGFLFSARIVAHDQKNSRQILVFVDLPQNVVDRLPDASFLFLDCSLFSCFREISQFERIFIWLA